MLARVSDEEAIEKARGGELGRAPGPGVVVYAAVVGLAGAVPVPLLDGVLTELARGAAVRRVAARHGVTLTPGARAVLSEGAGPSSTRGRLLRTAFASALAPFRVATRVQDASSTIVTAVLLDRFLRRAERAAGAALTEAEAKRVRAAIERASTDAGFDALRTVPLGVFDVVRDAFKVAIRKDPERRSVIERFVDALLDGAADAPSELVERLAVHFDQALAEEGGST